MGAVNPGYQGLLVGERRLADSLALEPRVQQRRVFLSCFCSLNVIENIDVSISCVTKSAIPFAQVHPPVPPWESADFLV